MYFQTRWAHQRYYDSSGVPSSSVHEDAYVQAFIENVAPANGTKEVWLKSASYVHTRQMI